MAYAGEHLQEIAELAVRFDPERHAELKGLMQRRASHRWGSENTKFNLELLELVSDGEREGWLRNETGLFEKFTSLFGTEVTDRLEPIPGQRVGFPLGWNVRADTEGLHEVYRLVLRAAACGKAPLLYEIGRECGRETVFEPVAALAFSSIGVVKQARAESQSGRPSGDWQAQSQSPTPAKQPQSRVPGRPHAGR